MSYSKRRSFSRERGARKEEEILQEEGRKSKEKWERTSIVGVAGFRQKSPKSVIKRVR